MSWRAGQAPHRLQHLGEWPPCLDWLANGAGSVGVGTCRCALTSASGGIGWPRWGAYPGGSGAGELAD